MRDFADAGIDLTGAVRQTSSEKALSQTVTNTTDQIIHTYVRFFIATGDEAKNYRLEVWSGDRLNSDPNEVGSFVAFDIVDYGDLTEENFNSYTNELLDSFAEEEGFGENAGSDLKDAYLENPDAYKNRTDGKELVLYRYSLYDDDDYASYDADHSSDTDPYADYDASTYDDAVAYLRYNYTEGGRTYYDTVVNYAANEITVASESTRRRYDDG